MSMSWQIFTVISVLLLSTSVLLQRILLNKDKLDPYAYASIFQGLVGVLLSTAALVYGFNLNGLENFITPAIVSVLAFGLGHVMYAKTLQIVEASSFSVLFASQAIWIMLFGIIFFNESLTTLQIIGAALIFICVGLLSPSIRYLKLDKGTLFGLITGVLFGVAITTWSYVGREIDTLSWAGASFIGTAFVSYLAQPKSLQKLVPLFKGGVFLKLLLLGVLYGVGSLTMLLAYKEGDFAIVTPLRQTAIVVTVILALLLLKNERNRVGIKMLSSIVCFIGVVLIVI